MSGPAPVGSGQRGRQASVVEDRRCQRCQSHLSRTILSSSRAATIASRSARQFSATGTRPPSPAWWAGQQGKLPEVTVEPGISSRGRVRRWSLAGGPVDARSGAGTFQCRRPAPERDPGGGHGARACGTCHLPGARGAGRRGDPCVGSASSGRSSHRPGHRLRQANGQAPQLVSTFTLNHYLTAAGVVSALLRRAGEGGSYQVTASLTRTSM